MRMALPVTVTIWLSERRLQWPLTDLTQMNSKQRKLYYVTIPESVVPNADEYGITTRPDDEVSTTIDISNYLEVKIQAVAAHRSQQDSRQFAEMLRQGIHMYSTTIDRSKTIVILGVISVAAEPEVRPRLVARDSTRTVSAGP